MQIVIDIPEKTKESFDKADDINFCFYDYNSVIGKAIRNAIPLSEVMADVKAAIEKELKTSDELELIGESAAYRKSLEIINKYICGKEAL